MAERRVRALRAGLGASSAPHRTIDQVIKIEMSKINRQGSGGGKLRRPSLRAGAHRDARGSGDGRLLAAAGRGCQSAAERVPDSAEPAGSDSNILATQRADRDRAIKIVNPFLGTRD